VLAALPETHRPIADELIRGGIPGVRQAVDRQNALLSADDKPTINPDPLMDIAERLMPVLRAAEWHDKADAALADVTEIDIRDLRSVVVAADVGARDEETRALADQLRTALAKRVDSEHHEWLTEIAQNLDDGRVVRALRLSSRPPKAGTPFPPELARRLADATGASLTADITADRYGTVLDALALSPVRQQVTPAAVPENPKPELVAMVRKLANRVPEIAALFGLGPVARAAAAAAAPASSPSAPIPPPPAAAPVVPAPVAPPESTAPAEVAAPDEPAPSADTGNDAPAAPDSPTTEVAS
jgi:hypothetical protein